MYAHYEKIRNSKSLNDYKVAKLANVSPSCIYDWKYGYYTPKIDQLIKIAKVLEVPVEELLTNDDD